MEAVNAIRDKLDDIVLLQRNINQLCAMIDDLALIVKAQTDLVNSIEKNMDSI